MQYVDKSTLVDYKPLTVGNDDAPAQPVEASSGWILTLMSVSPKETADLTVMN